jgi:hypothetical protein
VQLDTLIAEAEISELVLVHHAGHSGERSRGDSRLRDWPDVEWRLVRETPERPGEEPGPDAKRYFAAEGRDVAVPEGLLEYDRVTRRLTLAGGSRRETSGSELIPTIVELVAKPSPDGLSGWSGRAIESALTAQGHGQKKVRSGIAAARREGKVSTVSGPRNSTLHVISRSSASVRHSAPDALTHSGGECVSASIGDALHSLPADDPVSECVTDALDIEELSLGEQLGLRRLNADHYLRAGHPMHPDDRRTGPLPPPNGLRRCLRPLWRSARRT